MRGANSVIASYITVYVYTLYRPPGACQVFDQVQPGIYIESRHKLTEVYLESKITVFHRCSLPESVLYII